MSKRKRNIGGGKFIRFRDGEPGELPTMCPLCDDFWPQSNKFVKDHCHKCTYFRGWLCEVCNSYLANIEYPHLRGKWVGKFEHQWWVERGDFYLGAHICDHEWRWEESDSNG